jgi:uncharacterized ferritin-like protein (DUF455 family)
VSAPTVRSFAERVLFGASLADKLAPAPASDVSPGPPLTALPSAPGRPDGLRFDDPRPRPPSPRRADLDDAGGRGRILHDFANHELLALELMALMLLRFPDAPPYFRRGLVAVMADEQRHLAAYLDRMATCGVGLGDVPVSRFFWDALAGADDPAAFTAAMGLGLEQANLDFARQWAGWFRAAGDTDTAVVIDGVYADEVRHVRHAARVFPRLTGAPLTYDGWSARLVFPMSPARARGPDPDLGARARAGVPEAFVTRLLVAGHSRGRPPVVYRFRAAVEEDVLGRTPSKASRDVGHDLQHVPLLLAAPHDVVIAEPATHDLLVGLRAAGVDPCRIVGDPSELAGLPLNGLAPWGWSPEAARALAPLAPNTVAGVRGWSPPWRALYGKDWPVRWQASLEARFVPRGARVVADGDWVVKALYSASGTRRVRGVGPDLPHATITRWQAEDGGVVVQRWRRRVVDLSAHGDVTDAGPLWRGVVRFETGDGGAFRGAWLGPWATGLSPELQRFAHAGGPRHVERQLRDAWREVAEAAGALGYRGPIGVDAMIVDDGDGLQLVPVVEVNPRFTMGRVALALRSRLHPNATGWWRFRPVAALRADGGAEAWARAQGEAHPIRLERGRMRAGFLVTNDPATARVVLTSIELV